MIEGFRVVIDEDGYPRELSTASDFERAKAEGLLPLERLVTVYRTSLSPEVKQVREIRELQKLLGLDQAANSQSDLKPQVEAQEENLADETRPDAFERAADPTKRVRRAGIGRRQPTNPSDHSYTSSASEVVRQTGSQLSSNIEDSFWYWAARPLARYAQFKGRASRREYWSFAVFIILALVVAGLINEVLLGLTIIALIVPSWTVLVRRMHDFGWTGWVLLVGLLPYAGVLLILSFTLIRSDEHPNAYGPHPLR